MKPLVTVVVCTYNDEDTIGTVLEGIRRLAYEPLEVIVINDASTDRTREIIEGFPVLAVHNPSNRGLGYNQNLGLRMAKGELLALVQSDCEILDADWLDRMAELMTGDTAVVVSQRVLRDFAALPAGARLFNAVAPQDLVNASGKPVPLQYCRGKADLYRVSVLRELNGWSTEFFTAGEDTDLSIRLRARGHGILLHPTATVRYLFSGRQVSVGGALRKAFLYGRTAYPLYGMHRYDGIQARSYLAILVAGLSMALPPRERVAVGAAAFLYSWTCRIQTSGGRSVPLGLLAVLGCVPFLWLLDRGSVAAVSVPSLGLAVSGAAYAIYLAFKNSMRNLKKGDRAASLPATVLFCLGWRFASGIGYFAGFVRSLSRGLRRKEQPGAGS